MRYQPSTSACCRGLGPVPVAEHHVRPAHPQLAHLAARRAHLGLHARDGHAHGGRPGVVVRAREARDRRRGLGHPVELDDVAVRQPLEHAPLQLGRDRRRRVLQVAQTGGAGGVLEQHREHRRDEDAVRDAVRVDRLQHRHRLEARQDHRPRAHPRAGEHVRRARDVEHRAHVQPAVLPRMTGHREVVERVRDQVAVAEHHALGRAGGAAGVGDRRQRVLVHARERVLRPGHQRLVVHHRHAELLGPRIVGDQRLELRVLDHERQLLDARAGS